MVFSPVLSRGTNLALTLEKPEIGVVVVVVNTNPLRGHGFGSPGPGIGPAALGALCHVGGQRDTTGQALVRFGVFVFTLMPLMFGSPVGKELELPLAQVVLGGLVSATLLNMVVVPTVYYRVEQWREKRQATTHFPLTPQEIAP